MLSTIWQGAGTASDWFFLLGAIAAGLATLAHFVPPTTSDGTPRGPARYAWAAILLALAVTFVALGLLAI